MTDNVHTIGKAPLNVTFFMFSYNQEEYIEDACRAALAQTYSPLEIIFSDDCSTDRTYELIEKIANNYSGPHKVRTIRNQKNLGLIAHVNKAFETAAGQLLVLAAGDDISLPDRVDSMVQGYWRSEGAAMVIHSSATKINRLNEEMGILIPPCIKKPLSTIELARSESIYVGATAAVSQSLYKEFGPILFKDAYEDLVFGFRAAIKNSLYYVDKPLVKYRVDVGISAQRKHGLLNLSSRIGSRIKNLNTILAVFEQRQADISRLQSGRALELLKSALRRNIDAQRMKISLYQSPALFVRFVFSNNFLLGIRLLGSEAVEIFMPNWKLWLGLLRLRLRRLISLRK